MHTCSKLNKARSLPSSNLQELEEARDMLRTVEADLKGAAHHAAGLHTPVGSPRAGAEL